MAGEMTGGKRMQDLEANQIFSRQEIYPQPQVVCGRVGCLPTGTSRGRRSASHSCLTKLAAVLLGHV